MLRRRKIQLNWSVGLPLIPSRVDHSLCGATGDIGDAQHGKKDFLFPGAAIEYEDCIAGSKGVSQHIPYGSTLGTDPRTRKQVVILPGKTVKCHDCLVISCGGGGQVASSQSAADVPARRVSMQTPATSAALIIGRPWRRRIAWKKVDSIAFYFLKTCVMSCA
jgi:hypothetical protein